MTTDLAPSGTAAPFQEFQARSDIRKRLRAATHDIHVRLDHHPLLAGITKPGYPMESYQQVLLGYFSLYRRLEIAITEAISYEALNFDYEARAKLPWLHADLKFFDLPPPTAENAPRHSIGQFVIHNLAQLAGTLYAIEGATLGGQVIARHVAKTMGLTSTAGARFFNGYGDETAERWNTFESFMQCICVDESSQRQACDAAVTTFLIVERTLDEYNDKLCAPA
jgi:heme oxygenase